MAFAPGVKMYVGWTAPGTIRTIGTTAEPVTFTGTTDIPGSWVGIVIGYYADSSSLFDHVIVDNAGALYPVAGAFHGRLGFLNRST